MDLGLKHIALIGCGNMGGAILKAWLLRLPPTITYTLVSNSARRVASFLDSPAVSWVEAGDCLPQKPDLILIAVKPQVLEEALEPYKDYSPFLCLTIAAGKPLQAYRPLLGAQKIIRLMPNMPAAVGHSITTAFTDSVLTPKEKSVIHHLVSAFGEICWLENEELFHASTAIAGSGPAYVFLLVEALTKAGIQQGLNEKLAETLARQMVIGSGRFLSMTTDYTAEDLRQQVTSPGGTTEAALTLLLKDLPPLIAQAIARAVERSKELSQER